MEVSIGLDNIQQEKNAKLLGISFEDNQKWTHQVYGKNGVIAALNRRYTQSGSQVPLTTLVVTKDYIPAEEVSNPHRRSSMICNV